VLSSPPLDIAVDETDRAIGLMLLDASYLAALFADPDFVD
jgi:putative acetyltransferase